MRLRSERGAFLRRKQGELRRNRPVRPQGIPPCPEGGETETVSPSLGMIHTSCQPEAFCPFCRYAKSHQQFLPSMVREIPQTRRNEEEVAQRVAAWPPISKPVLADSASGKLQHRDFRSGTSVQKTLAFFRCRQPAGFRFSGDSITDSRNKAVTQVP